MGVATSDRPFTECAPGADGYRPDHMAAAHVGIMNADDGILDLRGRTMLALCGFAESSRAHIPVDDPHWIIVGLNQLYRHLPRWDVWFDLHTNWRDGLEGTDHVAWLRRCGIPVLMVAREAEVPTSVRYPITRILAKLQLDYFTSTASFMIAWAIDHIDRAVEAEAGTLSEAFGLLEAWRRLQQLYGRWTIALFGIDLIADEEFAYQRPCAEFWLGRAASRGIGIMVPPESALLKQAYRYGYQQEPETGLIRLSDLAMRAVELEAQTLAALSQAERLAGRREEGLYWQQIIRARLRGGAVLSIGTFFVLQEVLY